MAGDSWKNDERVRDFALRMMSQLPYEPNEQQTLLIVALAHFMLYAPERGVFLLLSLIHI